VTPTALPAALRERWQPLRSGLVNLYRYDDEQFCYEDGHLLLRGNNGTGKSRVLALQLPFLLDGEVSPHRMEPDADPSKRVEWNLLMGRHADRQGYTWLELGRRAPGGPEYLTIGCGLSAVEGRPSVTKWFFVTTRRVGRDLFLVSPAGITLGREKLTEAIGAEGEVFTTAAAYRQAVDERLFKLGRQRYEALVGLLIQLRQPQLSRHLDEERLSSALSEALRPPSSQMVADVAEAFRSLEDDRLHLEGFRVANAAVERFLREYRRYTQIATRRRAQVLRTAHSGYEAALRRLREAERASEEAKATATSAAEALAAARAMSEVAEAKVQALRDSPAMQDAQALRRVLQQRDGAKGRLDVAATNLATREVAAARAEQEREKESGLADASAESIQKRMQGVAAAAARVGVGNRHSTAVVELELPELHDVELVRRVGKALIELAEDRRRAGQVLGELAQKFERAEAAEGRSRANVEERQARVDEAAEVFAEAQASLTAAERDLVAAYRAWAIAVREVAPEEPDGLLAAVADWCRDPTGRSPVADAVDRGTDNARTRLAKARALEEAHRSTIDSQIEEREAEKARWLAGEHQPPAPPATRDVPWRSQAAGAPLWRLCDFVDGVDVQDRAGIEAALEAAGVLDAWVTPDGRLLQAGEHDVVLSAAGAAVAGPTLASVLRPAVDRADPRAASVTDEILGTLLGRIGLGESDEGAWVARDGRFHLGPLEGRWSKPSAQHIGEGAREADRRKRLEEIALTLGELERQREASTGALNDLGERLATVEAERGAAPNDQPVRGAAAALDAAGRALAAGRDRLIEAEARLVEARRQVEESRAHRDDAAADLGLGAWLADLAGLAEALSEYRSEAKSVEPALMAHLASRRALEKSRVAAEAARADCEQAVATVEGARSEHARFATEYEVLKSSVGAEVEKVLASLRDAQGEAEGARGLVKTRDREDREALEAKVRATGDVERAAGERTTKEAERDEAVASLVRFMATGLFAIATPDVAVDGVGTSPTRAVDIARAAEEALSRVDASDAAWERSSKGLLEQVQTAEQSLLAQGYQPSAVMEDTVIVVRVPFQGRSLAMAEFGDVLAKEITERQTLLGAREREVIENHLVGEVSLHLHDLLHAGERWVIDMNRELEDRPTSTGMTLRFAWDATDGDGAEAALVDVRKRLMRAGGTWSPRDREIIGAFLQQRIQAIRAARPAGTWQDHLGEALDYRRWHRFSIERRQDGVWRRLTRRTHGTGSGGEKAIALTIPQFAAAAAHYRSADQYAPRLIMLDEAFVGVDSDMRSKCMGLLATFDLDFVMTSEREWGCYPTLPGLAIYQLASRPGVDAVGVTRFVWNGRERLRVDVSPSGARAPKEESVQAP
jgi:uncharacterized protein (TIGR02680 family)